MMISNGFRDNFFRMPNDIVDYHDLDPYELAAFTVLVRFSNGNSNGQAWPSNAKISELANMSVRKARESIKSLIDKGYVIKEIRFDEKGSQTSNMYTVVNPHDCAPRHEVPPPYAQGATLPRHEVPPIKNNIYKEQEINKKSVHADWKKFYFENMGLAVPPDIEQQLESFAKCLSPELVIAATRRALEANARRYPFVKKLLTDWKEAGINTVEEMEEYENQRKNKVVNLRYKNRGVKHDAGYEQRLRDYEKAGLPF